MGYYSALRKDEVLPFATTWTDLSNIMLSKISHTEKVRNHLISVILRYKTEKKGRQQINKGKINKNIQTRTTVWWFPEERGWGA